MQAGHIGRVIPGSDIIDDDIGNSNEARLVLIMLGFGLVTMSSETIETASPVDALLADFASGRLARPLHTLVSSHLELKPHNHSYVRGLEALIAGEIEAAEVEAIEERARAARLDAIFNAAVVPVAPSSAAHHSLPLPLRRYIGSDLNDIRWRTKMPGLKEFHIETKDGYESSLLWIRAGRKMLSHTHDGAEVTLVLDGSFSDLNGTYARGDVAIADAEIDHAPRAGVESDCLCFAVTDAPVRLTGPIGRLFTAVFGH